MVPLAVEAPMRTPVLLRPELIGAMASFMGALRNTVSTKHDDRVPPPLFRYTDPSSPTRVPAL